MKNKFRLFEFAGAMGIINLFVFMVVISFVQTQGYTFNLYGKIVMIIAAIIYGTNPIIRRMAFWSLEDEVKELKRKLNEERIKK